jgi:ABC-2 type transport system permease protein
VNDTQISTPRSRSAQASPTGASWCTTLVAVTRLELSRARAVRVSLLFVASFQSIGILLLLRGVVDRGTGGGELAAEAVVAGCTVLVGAFTALNLLAQRLGVLRASGSLERYAMLPAPPSAVVLAHAAAYVCFTLPGAVLTAVLGVGVYGLAWSGLLLLPPVLIASAAMFAGVGALVGLLSPRAEIATVLGQLGMSAVIFIGVVPPGRLPGAVRDVRAALPPAQAVDALAAGFTGHPAAGEVLLDLVGCSVGAVLLLALAGSALTRALHR